MQPNPPEDAQIGSATRIVESTLRPDEDILWTGRPATWRVIEPSDWWALQCGVPWTIFVPLMLGPLFTGEFWLARAWWFLGIVLFLWVIIGGRLGWRKVVYLLTNQRAIIIWEWPYLPYRELDLNSCALEVQRLGQGRPGTVAFLPIGPLSRMDRYLLMGMGRTFDFVAIPDADDVVRLVAESSNVL